MGPLTQTNRLARINPFVFPPDTTFRFVLLVVSILGAGLFIFSSFASELYIRDEVKQCYGLAPRLTAGADLNDPTAQALYQDKSAAYFTCIAPFEWSRSMVQIGGILVLIGVGYIIYSLMPRWIVRRDHLGPLPAKAGLAEYLEQLCADVGLARQPLFLYAPLDYRVAGLAFGAQRQPYVTISGGLLQKYEDDPSVFRAVLLHEVAHLRNADVGKTYFAVALSLAFVFVALLPYIAFLLTRISIAGNLEFLLEVSWRVLALAVVVLCTLASVLRTRELYADARAEQSGGPDVLARLFGEDRPRAKQWWRVQMGRLFHPAPQQREQVLFAPDQLLNISF